MNRWISLILFSIPGWNICFAQNLPSLLSDKNINSTFSIMAYDKGSQEWGIAVATNNIYVGNSTIYIEPGVGAFSVIAETDPIYAINGFEQLKKRASIKEAIEYTRLQDGEHFNRQVAGIDASGNVYAFTGQALQYWQGNSTHLLGNGFVVMGNQLADSVLYKMAHTFEQAKGSLAQRLLQSLVAGQNAGGQITGKQSAALVVKGSRNEWFNQVDLRVDNSHSPFGDLQVLLNYHYGRIRINQAINAIRKKDTLKGQNLLQEAVLLVEGWNGIYNKIAMAWILLNNEEKAIAVIQKAIKENASWKENLPAFYCLYDHAAIRQLIDPDTFSLKDWNNAINFMTLISKSQDAIELGKKVLKQYPSSSYTHYLLGVAYVQAGVKKTALDHVQEALRLDADNAQAKELKQALIK